MHNMWDMVHLTALGPLTLTHTHLAGMNFPQEGLGLYGCLATYAVVIFIQ